MPGAPPMVLVMIDKDSRLAILRHEGVQVAFLDLRVDPVVLLLPEEHQMLELHAAIGAYPIVSLGHEDAMHTASVLLSRLENRQVVVAAGPQELERT